ncbi:SPOR domain-containing protein [Chlorogloeopsis sp. ULAP02]|uniref:SPOR domain-containing protein n=1 Tax=Chlorogloeopsis sp. ULAP02 TaxID=3107926 RepID=UPI003134A625
MWNVSLIQLIAFHRFAQPSLILHAVLGSFLANIFHTIPTTAQIPISKGFLAQQPAVYDGVPPQPPLPFVPGGNQVLPPPQINNGNHPIFQQNPSPPVYIHGQEYPQYQAVPFPPTRHNSQNFERYLVYVDSNNPQTLQQIRLIEPTAYMRNFEGRSVIQVGIFSQASNAQQRIQQLAASGINQGRIASFANGQETPTNLNIKNSQTANSKYYYVAIPAKSQDIPSITNQIRSNIAQRPTVSTRTQPRGSHVAVGPFSDRTIAEQWSRYLQSLGFGNARVYYGR